MNVDRYITDEALEACLRARLMGDPEQDDLYVLRAALPGVLAQHRADVLREAANDPELVSRDPKHHHPLRSAAYETTCCSECSWLEDGFVVQWPCPWADEAVAE